MIIWVDAQLSPALAPWIAKEFAIQAFSVRYLNLLRAKDPQIYEAARREGVVVMTKDVDFVVLQERLGPPPSIVWIRCGNTSNAHLKKVLRGRLPTALAMIRAGEPLVEITDLK